MQWSQQEESVQMIRTISVTSVEAFHSLMRLNITTFVRKAYFTYFDMHLGDQDKSLAPHKVCKPVKEKLCNGPNEKEHTCHLVC